MGYAIASKSRRAGRNAVAATGHGHIRFGRPSRRRRRRTAVRPALVLARVLEICLLVGIIVVLAASVVRIH